MANLCVQRGLTSIELHWMPQALLSAEAFAPAGRPAYAIKLSLRISAISRIISLGS